MIRPTLALPIIFTAAAVLSGCEGSAVTGINVAPAGEVTYRISAEFSGEAATALAPGTPSSAALSTLFDNRTGHRPTFDRSDGHVSASVDVTAAQLPNLAEVTGVRKVVATSQGDTHTVVVSVGPATGLLSALRDASKKEPEPEATFATMLSSTRVVVNVTYPSLAKTVGPPPAQTSLETLDNGKTLRATRAVTAPTVTWTTVGHAAPTVTRTGQNWLPLGIAAFVALAVGAVWLRRRNTRRL